MAEDGRGVVVARLRKGFDDLRDRGAFFQQLREVASALDGLLHCGGQLRVAQKNSASKAIVPKNEAEVAAIRFLVEGSEAGIFRVDLANAEQVQAEDFESV